MNIYIILIIVSIITTILFANYLYNYLLLPIEPVKDISPYGYCNISKPYIKPFEINNILTELAQILKLNSTEKITISTAYSSSTVLAG